MRWRVLCEGKPSSLYVQHDTHEDALRTARKQFSPSLRPHVQVEPAPKAGSTAAARHYSQSGPILTEAELQ